MPEHKLQGKVKSYHTVKGWGFISPSDGGKDVFLHHTDLDKIDHKSVAVGQGMKFNIGSDPMRPGKECAVDLELILLR